MSVWKSKDIKTACALGCAVVDNVFFVNATKKHKCVCKRRYEDVCLLPVSDEIAIGNGSWGWTHMSAQRYMPGYFTFNLEDIFSTGDGSVAVKVDETWLYIG